MKSSAILKFLDYALSRGLTLREVQLITTLETPRTGAELAELLDIDRGSLNKITRRNKHLLKLRRLHLPPPIPKGRPPFEYSLSAKGRKILKDLSAL